jgi:hypothetical protein
VGLDDPGFFAVPVDVAGSGIVPDHPEETGIISFLVYDP